MSKIVVGMNSRPGDHAAQDRLRIAEHQSHRARSASSASRRLCGAPRLRREQKKSSDARSTRPATPMPIQNVLHGTPAAMTGPTTNWPAEPPAMPNICVAPISVAAREAGSWWWRCRRRRPARTRRRRPAGTGRRWRASLLPVANSSAPMPTRRRAERDDLARPELIHRHAGDEAERRVAVVEEPDQRGDADGAEAEGVRQLRHHHRRRRAQRVLIEVVDRRDQPGDRCRLRPRFIAVCR